MSPEELAEALSLAVDTTDRVLADRVPKLVAEVKRLQACLAELVEDAALLAALRAAGVDNWEGYSHAHDILREWEDDS